ncbi:MAG: hypothetical protein OXI79_19585 [Gammaproteobacteria bacterium]|nr:hypothetical protein [Gammaproteobacteria bacterium]
MTASDPVADFVAAACDQLADLEDAIDNGIPTCHGDRIPLDLSAIDRLRVPLGRLAVRTNELAFRLADTAPARPDKKDL